MYKLRVQLIDLAVHGDPVIHEIISINMESIQEAFESFDGKDAYEGYLACEEDLLKSINQMKEREPGT